MNSMTKTNSMIIAAPPRTKLPSTHRGFEIAVGERNMIAAWAAKTYRSGRSNRSRRRYAERAISEDIVKRNQGELTTLASPGTIPESDGAPNAVPAAIEKVQPMSSSFERTRAAMEPRNSAERRNGGASAWDGTLGAYRSRTAKSGKTLIDITA